MIKSIFIYQRADNSAIFGPISPNFKLTLNFMAVLVTCKNERDQNKNENSRLLTTLNIDLRCSRAGNSAVSGEIWPKFKPSKVL